MPPTNMSATFLNTSLSQSLTDTSKKYIESNLDYSMPISAMEIILFLYLAVCIMVVMIYYIIKYRWKYAISTRDSKLLTALLKWVCSNCSPDSQTDFINWFYSGQPATNARHLLYIKSKLGPCFSILTTSNGDVKFVDENDKTILHYCITSMEDHMTVNENERRRDKILLTVFCELGASIITNDRDGKNPLGIALEKNRIDLVETLVHFGCMNDKNCNDLGQTSLHIILSMYSNQNVDDRIKFNKIVKDLVHRKGEDLNKREEKGLTPLDFIAETFDEILIEQLKSSGTYLYSETSTGDNLLMLICKNIAKKNDESLSYRLIDWLLEQGFKANFKNKYNFTPLHYASQLFYNLDIIKSLVDVDADIHAVANDNTNPLHSASMSCSFEVMQYFVKRGVDLNRRDSFYGFSLIHMASMSYDEKNIKWLIANGFDPKDLSKSGLSPLHLASRIGNSKVVEKLIECGATVNCKDINYKYTPLHLAIMKDNFLTLQDIITTRSSFKKVDENLSLVSHCFKSFKLRASENDYNDIVVMLLKAEADVNSRDIYNRTPLHYATLQSSGNDVVKLLMAGAQEDDLDSKFLSPLHNCLLSGNSEGFQYLLMRGVDINDIEHPSRDIFEESKESTNSIHLDVLKHLVKLKLVQLPINEIYKPYLTDKNLDQYYEKFADEVMQLKKLILVSDVSLYDFLHMNVRRRIGFIRNLPSDRETKFPNYYLIILGKRNEAVTRTRLLEPSMEAFRSLTRLQWPDLCVENILSFLNNRTLRALIECMKKNE